MSTADWIGRSHERIGARDRVTGALRYAADLSFEDALHVKLVQVDGARSTITRIDRDAAANVPGVRCVLIADDLPRPMPRFGPTFSDRPILATGETKFHGEPVAAVVATTKGAAEEAAALVNVETVPLPAVLSVEQALDPASPLVQDPSLRPGDPLANTNVLRAWKFGWGHADDAVAHLLVEH
jgi:CO/xanthine dehydrogenase Mo-binding subunit